MPTYQYACTECAEQLEVQQSFTDDALTQCPACGGRLRKVFNAVGVVFKGSGFYRTDSRAAAENGKRDDKAATGAETTSSGDDKAGGAAKGEAGGSGAAKATDAKPAGSGGKTSPVPAKAGSGQKKPAGTST